MKAIKTSLITLILVLTALFSFTSCFGNLVDILAPSVNGGEEGGTEGGTDGSGNKDNSVTKPSGGDGGADEGSGTDGDQDGDQNGDAETPPIEFYPGSSEVTVEGEAKAVFSVLSIVSSFEVSYGRTQKSVGSGVIYKLDKASGDAYIITNYHVVFNRYATTPGGISTDISLYLYGMELNTYKISATYVGGSLTQDLAVLKVSGSEILKNSYARAADIGSSDDVCIFDRATVIGNPEGFGISVTQGIVSVDSEKLEMTGADGITALSLRVIRVDGAINEGNSGGGLFDERGDLIGIVNAKRTGSEVDNIGYAIPISYAKNLADNIIHYCDGETLTTPYKCIMGITVTAKVMGVEVDEEGRIHKVSIVEIQSFTENSITKDRLQIGDVILSLTIDGVKKDVSRIHHVIDHMLTARVGSTLVVEFERDGVKMSETFTITEDALVAVE